MATTIKTAISIQKSLFEQADSLAEQLNISRSHLISLAIEAYVQNYQNQTLLAEINLAYSEEPDPAENIRLAQMRRQQRKLVEGEW
jgi:metal-responsive CopG/Arc/MetJ family transcriptional regulator